MLKRNINGGNTNNMWGWGTFWLVLAVAYFVSMMVGFRQANAAPLNPAEWTTTEGGLTLTLVSMQQYGEDIEPVWSNTLWDESTNSFGAYYFPTANNSDRVRFGVRVDGMQDGINYEFSYGQILTSADNGQVFYKEGTPSAFMGESWTCQMFDGEEHCYSTPLTNEYTMEAMLHKQNDWGDYPRLKLIFRPQSVGSSNIEITSVKQGDEDVVLNLTGRTVAEQNAPHPINEYQLEHYNQPVTISYRLKNLVVGNQYSLSVGNGSYSSFTATDTVMTGSKTVTLDLVSKHVNLSISLYGEGTGEGDHVPMYFAVTDSNFKPLGSIVIDEIRQGNEVLTGTPMGEGSPKTYSFEANDVEDLDIGLHAMDATRDMDYYLTFYYRTQMGGSYRSPMTVRVSGEELFMGAHIIVPAIYGGADDSPFNLNIYASATDSGGYSSIKVFYQGYDASAYSSDTLQITFIEDENIPRYTGSLSYTNPEATEPEIFDSVINAEFHNVDNPLKFRIEGQHYDPTQNYNIAASVTKGEEDVRNFLFSATGAELNAGKDFILENLVLSLPQFDPNGSLSGYEDMYRFTVDINGLEQSGYFYYMYSGWASTVMTYDGGKVVAMGDMDGIGAAGAYIVVNGANVRRSSLDGSKHAKIHYIGEGFDPNASYGYRLFYNSSANNTWSATAGQMIENGVMPGSTLNSGEFFVDVRVPEDGAKGAMYTLVIERDGGLVILVRDYLTLTDEPMIESFKFNADDESFMQTGSNSYRMAQGVNATATLTGAGFDNAEQYKLWVHYGGYRMVEDEYGGYGMHYDLPELSEAFVLTGAQLNNGYVYAIDYDEAFATLDGVNVSFRLTDLDALDPFTDTGGRGGMGEMSILDATGGARFGGHAITIEYVPAEEVFNEHGYQIDENSGIVDVSGGEEPSGGPSLDNRTKNEASAEIEDGSLTVISQKPVKVVGVKNGVYSQVNAGAHRDEGGNTRTCWYDVSDYASVIVVLKGDGNMDGRISIADSNMINKSKVSPTLERVYRPLSDIEKIVLDLNNNGSVTIADSTIINKSLVSESLTNIYQPITWD